MIRPRRETRVPSLLLLLGLLLAPLGAFAEGSPPRVVATIKPLHALASGVLGESAELLVPGGASPHTYSLRPAAIRAISRADLLLWVGPPSESFMVRALNARSDGARVIQVLELPGLTRLAARSGGLWGDSEPRLTEATTGSVDPHVWLDPRNARVIVEALVEALVALNPAAEARYRANAEALKQRLRDLDQGLQSQLAPVQDIPFLVFHDAYQYVEHRYNLHSVGSLVVHPDRPAGARRVQQLKEQIDEVGVCCVFREPQFRSPLVDVLIEETAARLDVLDPLGSALEPGPASYFILMRQLGAHLRSCLATCRDGRE